MWRAVLCEDNPEQAQWLAELIRREAGFGMELTVCKTVKALEKKVEIEGWPELLFMDIQIGEDDGIEVVKRLAPQESGTQVIYVTGFIEYCTKVYETEHISFLTKPVRQGELKIALDHARERIDRSRREGIAVKAREGVYFLPLSDIQFIESVGRKVLFYTSRQVYESYAKLSDVQKRVDERFYQCHKSFIVNLDRVAACEKKQYVLKNGQTVPISARNQGEAKQKFLHYLSDRV